MDTKPSKSDINAVFDRLRVVPTNKTCFDCNARNPTWASVTYGVFLCIDCAAVHRNLGVHLTFVRSTQLDTNWTWVQLRQMQLGGNANAQQFFTQHNCVTINAQKKYNSRTAQLYRDKLEQLAINAVKNNTELSSKESVCSTKLHLDAHTHETKQQQDKEEEDFFTEHENFIVSDAPQIISKTVANEEKLDKNAQLEDGPKVDFSMKSQEERKSTIGTRKVVQKKGGLGAKKSGLGATKVKTNFAELEREAELAEELKLRTQEENAKAAALSAQEKVEREAAMRLAYKDISMQQQKQEEQLKKIDPKKAEQLERLGMGVNNRTGVSHSMLSDMQTIEQENLQSTPSALSALGKMRLADDNPYDNFAYLNFSMNRNASNKDLFFSETTSNKDQWVIVDDPASNSTSTKHTEKTTERTPTKTYDVSTSDLAQKKFGNAKGISSQQFFDDGQKDYETQANLSRFQGSSSISSSDFFGTNAANNHHNPSFQTPDLEDVRESVRQGVTKVAGKLSSLANGVMSSLQERYGY